MSTVEKLVNDQSMSQLLTDYLTCKLYLQESLKGNIAASKGVREAVTKRLDQLQTDMLAAVVKKKFADHPTQDTVHQAALQLLNQHPSGSDYFLNRLGVR